MSDLGSIGSGLSNFTDSFLRAKSLRGQEEQAAVSRALQQRQQDLQQKQFQAQLAGQGLQEDESGAFGLTPEAQAEKTLRAERQQVELDRSKQAGLLDREKFNFEKQKFGRDSSLKERELAQKQMEGKNKFLDKEFDLSQKYVSDPTTKRTAEMHENVNKIVQSAQAKNAAGDMSLIFSYMKLVDPGSTVREGEFATAQNSAGVSDQVRNAYNKAKSGERLSEGQRVEFANQGIGLFESQMKSQGQVSDQFSGFASDYGVRPDRVVRKYDVPQKLVSDQESGGGGLLSKIGGLLRGSSEPKGLNASGIETRTLKNGETVRVRKLPDGSYEEAL